MGRARGRLGSRLGSFQSNAPRLAYTDEGNDHQEAVRGCLAGKVRHLGSDLKKSRDELGVFYGCDFLNEERLKLELSITMFDGVFVSSKHVNNSVAVNQNELSFV